MNRSDPIVPGEDWCGSVGSEWVPDNPLGFDFTEPCKHHDHCYDVQVPRNTCDKLFLIEANAVCRDYPLAEQCMQTALIYYLALVLKGEKAYRNAGIEKARKASGNNAKGVR